jgi:hypothetical protein
MQHLVITGLCQSALLLILMYFIIVIPITIINLQQPSTQKRVIYQTKSVKNYMQPYPIKNNLMKNTRNLKHLNCVLKFCQGIPNILQI